MLQGRVTSIKSLLVAETIGYMITWTTYGTWLQGDRRRFVKNREIHPPNKLLYDANKQKLSKNPVKLSKNHRQEAANAIIEKAKELNQKIYALSVFSNHVHIVAKYIPKPIGMVVAYYKNAAQVALRRMGLTGRVWTKGFDKRYCFDEKVLQKKIDYVNAHSQNT
jgi:REP element-mobilizing transposase RayT